MLRKRKQESYKKGKNISYKYVCLISNIISFENIDNVQMLCIEVCSSSYNKFLEGKYVSIYFLYSIHKYTSNVNQTSANDVTFLS